MKNIFRKKSGFTLIELMIVVAIIGILSSIAIPAFINYVKKSKTSEASMNLQTMFTGAAAYYEQEHWAQGLVTSGAATSTTHCTVDSNSYGIPNESKQIVDYGADPTMKALHFSSADPMYYVYHVVQSSAQCDNIANDSELYRFHAHGDLDGDGTETRFVVEAGSNGDNVLYRSPGMAEETGNEIE